MPIGTPKGIGKVPAAGTATAVFIIKHEEASRVSRVSIVKHEEASRVSRDFIVKHEERHAFTVFSL